MDYKDMIAKDWVQIWAPYKNEVTLTAKTLSTLAKENPEIAQVVVQDRAAAATAKTPTNKP